MYLFALTSFILALLNGRPLPEQDWYDVKGEEVDQRCNICQVTIFSDAIKEDLFDKYLS